MCPLYDCPATKCPVSECPVTECPAIECPATKASHQLPLSAHPTLPHTAATVSLYEEDICCTSSSTFVVLAIKKQL